MLLDPKAELIDQFIDIIRLGIETSARRRAPVILVIRYRVVAGYRRRIQNGIGDHQVITLIGGIAEIHKIMDSKSGYRLHSGRVLVHQHKIAEGSRPTQCK